MNLLFDCIIGLIPVRDVIRRVGEDHLIVDGLLILLIAQIALLMHLLQAVKLACAVVFRVNERIIVRGELRDTDQAGALRRVKLGDILAKILFRRRLDAVAALTQIECVQVGLNDCIFIVILLQIECSQDLVILAGKRHVFIARHVLDELLRNGGPAGIGIPDDYRDRPEPVNAMMFFKTLVLQSDGRLWECLRHIFKRDPDAVFRPVQPGDLNILIGSVFAVDNSRLVLVRLVLVQIDDQIAVDHGDHIDPYKQDDHHSRHDDRGKRTEKNDLNRPFFRRRHRGTRFLFPGPFGPAFRL